MDGGILRILTTSLRKHIACMHACSVSQLCLTLSDTMDCSPPSSSCPWGFPGMNTGVGCRFILQGIFLTQASNPRLLCLLYRPADSLPLSHLGSPNTSLGFPEKLSTICWLVAHYGNSRKLSFGKLWSLWVDLGLSLFFPLPIKQGILRTQILAVNCLGLTRIWYH